MVFARPPSGTGRYLTDPGTGHLWWWQHEEAKVIEKKILEEHGTIARWNGPLGVGFLYRSPAWYTLIPCGDVGRTLVDC